MKKKETEFHKIWELSKEEGEKVKKEIKEGKGITPIMIMDEENIAYKTVVISIHPEYLKQHPEHFSTVKMLSTRNLKTGKIKAVVTMEYPADDSEFPFKKIKDRWENMPAEVYEKGLKIFTDMFEKEYRCKIKIHDLSDCKTPEEVMKKMEEGNF